ncbi:MAG: GNAT family N-acetyltransferase [Ilumatobacter sp.]|uniref:GNAT family N-acetyltransferase n=1 Tax=Ilumatobacter sp. TaxID=1967498 RepID=UPI0026267D1E|nr:GNAT family N-acetyltransferase [Ilumatobacter sp.]MDJ0768516.1 GNAT family N-acetyltransferase [Ilumatobacter sp.]
MTVEYRELGARDATLLVDLMDAVVPDWRRREVEGGPDRFLADPNTLVLGAFDVASGVPLPVGWAWAVGIRQPNGWSMAYLHQLDVVASHRRRGIGRQLVEHAMAVARQRGHDRFWLSTGGHNEVANAMYASLGGERKELGDVNYWWQLVERSD